MQSGQQIRVCMVSGFRPTPGGGGTEKHLYELTRGLLDRGVHVCVICEDQSYLPDDVNELQNRILGIDPESLQATGKVQRFYEKSRLFARELQPECYDIVHCHNHYGYHVARMLARLRQRPVLISTFHLTPIGMLERYKQLGIPQPDDELVERAVTSMERRIARLSDRCIAVSRMVAEEVEQYYGVSAERIRTVYNWYDPAIFAPIEQEAARRLLGLSPDAHYLLYIGQFNIHRGRILADAMRRLPPDVTLLVVHPEPDKAVQAEFGHRVRFVGYQPPQRLAIYYSAVDLQCFPAVYGAFGLTLVEGMACGCPPVVFNLGAMNEVVTPASGYLVDGATSEAYAEAVHGALTDGNLKREAAIARARRFDMKRQIDSVRDLYADTLRQNTAARGRRRPNGRGAGGSMLEAEALSGREGIVMERGVEG